MQFSKQQMKTGTRTKMGLGFILFTKFLSIQVLCKHVGRMFDLVVKRVFCKNNCDLFSLE